MVPQVATSKRSLYDDVPGGDVKRVAQIFEKYGDLIEAESNTVNSWMDLAAYYGQFEMMEFLRSKGFTYTHSPKGRPLGLFHEAHVGNQLEMTSFLLEKGLFSNEQRILIAAEQRREIARGKTAGCRP